MKALLLLAVGSTLVGLANAADTPSSVGQVPESLKRKLKPAAMVKKPVVVRQMV